MLYKLVEPLVSWGTMLLYPYIAAGNLVPGLAILTAGEVLSRLPFVGRTIVWLRDRQVHITRVFDDVDVGTCTVPVDGHGDDPAPPVDPGPVDGAPVVADTDPAGPAGRPDRPTVYLTGPHGLFCIGTKRLLGTRLVPPGTVALFDPMLYNTSPGATWSARTLGHPTAPLTHAEITRIMGSPERPSITVVPGGFVEAAGATGTTECFYPDKIPYYQRMCRKYGYRLRYLMIYGGSGFYHHHGILRGVRLRLAHAGIPSAVATPRLCVPDLVAVRPYNIDPGASITDITDRVRATYADDMVSLGGTTGAKSLVVQSRL